MQWRFALMILMTNIQTSSDDMCTVCSRAGRLACHLCTRPKTCVPPSRGRLGSAACCAGGRSRLMSRSPSHLQSEALSGRYQALVSDRHMWLPSSPRKRPFGSMQHATGLSLACWPICRPPAFSSIPHATSTHETVNVHLMCAGMRRPKSAQQPRVFTFGVGMGSARWDPL